MDTTLIGRRVRQARRAQDLTQPALGKKAGVSYNTICRLERGQAPHVAGATLYNLAVALGVTLDWLCGRPEHTPPSGISEGGVVPPSSSADTPRPF